MIGTEQNKDNAFQNKKKYNCTQNLIARTEMQRDRVSVETARLNRWTVKIEKRRKTQRKSSRKLCVTVDLSTETAPRSNRAVKHYLPYRCITCLCCRGRGKTVRQCMYMNLCLCETESETERGEMGERVCVVNLVCGWWGRSHGLTVKNSTP